MARRNTFIDPPPQPPDPPQPVASWYTPGFSDGLGDRLLMSDNASATSLELLRFHRKFGARPRFERALRERVEELEAFRHETFAVVRAVDYLGEGEGLALVSDHTPGRRLSEVVADARGPSFAWELVRRLTPAVAALQQQGIGVAHGALTADRIIVTPEGKLVIVEHVLATALESLELPLSWLRAQLGIAVPGNEVVLDPRNDVIQIGLVALSLLLGRRIDPAQYPSRTDALIAEFPWDDRQVAAAAPLRGWIERALSIDGAGFESAEQAADALVDLPRLDSKLLGSKTEKTDRWAKVARGRTPEPAEQVDPVEPVESEPEESERPTVESFIDSWTFEPPAYQPPPAPVPTPHFQAESFANAPTEKLPTVRVSAPVEPPRQEPPHVDPALHVETVPPPAPPEPSVPAAAVAPPPAVARRPEPAVPERPAESAPTETRYVLYAVKPSAPAPAPPAPPASSLRPAAPEISRPLPAPVIPHTPPARFAESPPKFMVETFRPMGRHGDNLPALRAPGADQPARETLASDWMARSTPKLPDDDAKQGLPTVAKWVVAILTGLTIGMSVFILGVLTGNVAIGWPLLGRSAPRVLPPITAATPVSPTQPLEQGGGPSRRAGAAGASAAGASTGASDSRIEITSDPPGARVTVDGRAQGRTPLLLPVRAGQHAVVITDGSSTTRRTVNATAGSTATVVATFAPAGVAAGWVTLSSPIDLDVFQNGTLVGNSKVPRLMLPAGRHTLDVANAALGFSSQVAISVAPGKTATASVTVPDGSISINAMPWANVWLDGRSLGATPVANLAVPLGTHEVIWRHPVFGERRQSAVVTARGPLRLMIDLTRQ